jgi:hypothetical protein
VRLAIHDSFQEGHPSSLIHFFGTTAIPSLPQIKVENARTTGAARR